MEKRITYTALLVHLIDHVDEADLHLADGLFGVAFWIFQRLRSVRNSTFSMVLLDSGDLPTVSIIFIDAHGNGNEINKKWNIFTSLFYIDKHQLLIYLDNLEKTDIQYLGHYYSVVWSVLSTGISNY